MLNAILQGKTSGSGPEGIRLSEDLLTSTVFERLLYLPDEIIIAILFDPSAWINSATKMPKEISEHKFWPWWEPTKNTAVAKLDEMIPPDIPDDSRVRSDDQKSVEPDLIIKFDDRVLVIEAKRWDFCGTQRWTQLARQYARASLYFPGTPVWQLAVGGLRDERRNTKKALHDSVLAELHRLYWQLPDEDFHFGALTWHELFRMTAAMLGGAVVYRRLMIDLRRGLSAHGIRVQPPQCLGQLTSKEWRSAIGTISPSSISVLARPGV